MSETPTQTPTEPTISVNDKQYKVSDLSKTALANLQHLRFAETEIKRTQMQLAIMQTSVVAYKQALIQNLPDGAGAKNESGDGAVDTGEGFKTETIA